MFNTIRGDSCGWVYPQPAPVCQPNLSPNREAIQQSLARERKNRELRLHSKSRRLRSTACGFRLSAPTRRHPPLSSNLSCSASSESDRLRISLKLAPAQKPVSVASQTKHPGWRCAFQNQMVEQRGLLRESLVKLEAHPTVPTNLTRRIRAALEGEHE